MSHYKILRRKNIQVKDYRFELKFVVNLNYYNELLNRMRKLVATGKDYAHITYVAGAEFGVSLAPRESKIGYMSQDNSERGKESEIIICWDTNRVVKLGEWLGLAGGLPSYLSAPYKVLAEMLLLDTGANVYTILWNSDIFKTPIEFTYPARKSTTILSDGYHISYFISNSINYVDFTLNDIRTDIDKLFRGTLNVELSPNYDKALRLLNAEMSEKGIQISKEYLFNACDIVREVIDQSYRFLISGVIEGVKEKVLKAKWGEKV